MEANGFQIGDLEGFFLEGHHTEIHGEFHAPWADDYPEYSEYIRVNAGRRKEDNSKFVCYVDIFSCHTGIWEEKANLAPAQEKLIYDTMKEIYDDLYMDRQECIAENWRPFLAD